MQPAPPDSPDAQNPAAKPSLLATFHVAKDKEEVIDRLQEALRQGLDLEEVGPGEWSATDENWTEAGDSDRDSLPDRAFLLRFDLLAVPKDTTFLQVVLNAEGDVEGGWEFCRQKLEECLEAETLDGIWGYTLHYQAELNPGLDSEETFEKLRPAAELLHSGKGPYPSLAQARMKEGWMWLLTEPTEGEGSAAGTVYIALDDPDQDGGFGRALLGEGAGLRVPELIAHKSYFERRQYRGKRYREYREYLDNFREFFRKLLNEPDKRGIRGGKAGELTKRYNKLAEMVWELEDLRVSMVQQLYNYDEWKITGDNDVFQYHRRRIQTSIQELELLVGEGQYALEVAYPTLPDNSNTIDEGQSDIDAFLESQQALIETLAQEFQTHYDKPNQTKIKNWLTLFESPRRMELALKLLQNITYIGDDRLTDLFKDFYEDLVEEDNRTAMFTMLGGPQDSSSHLLYLCSKTLEEKEKTPPRFREMSHIMRSEPPEDTVLVFVDDNLISGVQGTQIFREWFGLSESRESVQPLYETEKAWLKKARLLYFPVIGFREGINYFETNLKKLGLDIEVRPGVETSSQEGSFRAARLIFKNREEREEAKQMASEIGYELLADKNWSEQRRREFSLGYGNFQALLVFSYNTPTGTLPIFWKDGEYRGRDWTPLFPRRA